MHSTPAITHPATRSAAPFGDDDPRTTFAKAVALASAVIDGVGRQQLGAPTPCPEFDVRALCGHLVAVLARLAAVGRGEDPWTVPEVISQPADDWLAAWRNAAHEVQAAYSDDAILDRPLQLGYAELPGAGTLALYTSEVTVHTWDLAVATGQRPAWDDQVVAVALDKFGSMLPSTDPRPAAVPFADCVPVDDGAATIERLIALNGRDPAYPELVADTGVVHG